MISFDPKFRFRRFHSLWFLSDVDYQRAWGMFLIEGFLHDLFHRAAILRSNKPLVREKKRNKETVEFAIRQTYRTPHNPIVILRSVKNHKLLRDLFPSARLDLAFAKRHSLVGKFRGCVLRLWGNPESRLGVNSGFPPPPNVRN